MRSWLIAGLLACASLQAQAEDLSIAAAADLQFCLPDLNAKFSELHPGVHIVAVTGSSGNFFTQIKNGAPFDVFLSADEQYPQSLVSSGQADPASVVHYARGQLVLWTLRKDIDLGPGVNVVTQEGVRHVALANPDHAPYGRAGRSALQAAGVWEAVQPKIVLGENIAQTLQFVQSGNADIGLVALSLLMAPALQNQGHYVKVAQVLYAPLIQAAVVTNHGKSSALAHAYTSFLSSTSAQAIFDGAGFLKAP